MIDVGAASVCERLIALENGVEELKRSQAERR
jgi:hypothetical protein